MRNRMVRGLMLGALVVGLAIPGGVWGGMVSAAQQSGPQKAPPPLQEQKKDDPKKGQEPDPSFSITVEVPLVTVDVVATDNRGGFLTGLRKENFRVLEDGVPQVVTNFAPTDAPITMVILMEFSKLGYQVFAYNARVWAYDFMRQLNPKDWVALVSYDMRTRLEVDFTQNKAEVQDAILGMYFPGFREANLFDALLETLDRLKDVKGKKSILILASGYDTFSKANLDKTYKATKETDVTIFAVGVGRELVEYLDARGQMGGIGRVDYAQAENQMRTFARMTGGFAWFPRFQGEMPGIFAQVAAMLRHQYSLGYIPSNRNQDGKFRRIKVELVDADGQPLVVTNDKGKKQKFYVYAREGYTASKGGVVEMRTGGVEVAKK